jgi:hypothetical protein
LIRLGDAVERQDAGEVEVRIDHRFPESAESHQVLTELLLAVGLGQDAGTRRWANPH